MWYFFSRMNHQQKIIWQKLSYGEATVDGRLPLASWVGGWTQLISFKSFNRPQRWLFSLKDLKHRVRSHQSIVWTSVLEMGQSKKRMASWVGSKSLWKLHETICGIFILTFLIFNWFETTWLSGGVLAGFFNQLSYDWIKQFETKNHLQTQRTSNRTSLQEFILTYPKTNGWNLRKK